MIKILLAFSIIASVFMYCDARQDCYEQPGIVSGEFCEGLLALEYTLYNQRIDQIPQDTMVKTLYFCLKQQRDRKTCDSKSQYWPLPNNFNQGKNRGL